MSFRLKCLDVLSAMVPAGALGSRCSSAQPRRTTRVRIPSNSLPLATRGVSERLDAPREAVSELDPPTIGPISGITGGPAVAPNAVKADNVFGE
jgi:hypothetical protein